MAKDIVNDLIREEREKMMAEIRPYVSKMQASEAAQELKQKAQDSATQLHNMFPSLIPQLPPMSRPQNSGGRFHSGEPELQQQQYQQPPPPQSSQNNNSLQAQFEEYTARQRERQNQEQAFGLPGDDERGQVQIIEETYGMDPGQVKIIENIPLGGQNTRKGKQTKIRSIVKVPEAN